MNSGLSNVFESIIRINIIFPFLLYVHFHFYCMCMEDVKLLFFLRPWRRKSNNLKRCVFFFSLFIWCFPFICLPISDKRPLWTVLSFARDRYLPRAGRLVESARARGRAQHQQCCQESCQILPFSDTWKTFCPSKTSVKDHILKKKKAWRLGQEKMGNGIKQLINIMGKWGRRRKGRRTVRK